MIALLIMSILATLAWRGIESISRARAYNETRLEKSLRLETVLAQWEQDLRSLQDPLIVPALQFDGATLRLVRQGNNGLQVVAWSLKPDPSGGAQSYRLMRWAGPSVTRMGELRSNWERVASFQGQEAGQLTLVRGLSQWQIYLFRGNGWANAQSSADLAPVPESAPPASSPASGPAGDGRPPAQNSPRELLPQGVRVELTFSSAGPNQAPILIRDIALGPVNP
jgi:general secretion pathway protein J